MKKLLLPVCLIAFTFASAQQMAERLRAAERKGAPLYSIFSSEEFAPALTSPRTNKTQVQDSRTIIYRHDTKSAGVWKPDDSTTYTYSGTRGYDDWFGWKFEEQVDYWYLSGSFKPLSRKTVTYNGHDDPLLLIKSSWATNTWVKSKQTVYTWDSKDRLVNQTEFTWNSNTQVWDSTSREMWQYHNNTDLYTSYEVQFYLSGAWDNSFRFLRTYDAFDAMTLHVYETGDGTQWNTEERLIYTNDANNRPTQFMKQRYDQLGSQWDDTVTRHLFTYDGNGNSVRTVQELWNSNNGAWAVDSRWERDYDGNNRQTEERHYDYDANSSKWLTLYRNTKTYDGDGNLVIEAEYDSLSSGWINSLRFDRTFNSVNRELTKIRSTGNGSSGWNEGERWLSDFQLFENGLSAIENLPFTSFTIFPNPFSSQLSLRLNGYATGNAGLTLTDVMGKVVMEKLPVVTDAGQQLNVSVQHLNPGIYFCRIQTDAGTYIQRIVKNN